MELFKSLETRTKTFSDPFKHFEINEPLTQNAIDEICSADIADPRKQNLNYDGTRALDGGEGVLGGYREYCPLSEVDGWNHYFVHLHVHQRVLPKEFHRARRV